MNDNQYNRMLLMQLAAFDVLGEFVPPERLGVDAEKKTVMMIGCPEQLKPLAAEDWRIAAEDRGLTDVKLLFIDPI